MRKARIVQLAAALRMLNPQDVNALARREITFGILTSNDEFANEVERFLFPQPAAGGSPGLIWVAEEADFDRATLGFAEPGIPHPRHFYAFDPYDAGASVSMIIGDRANKDLLLALARTFPGFRPPVSERLIWDTAKENTLFSATTSLPNILPSLFTLPWAIGEFASDTTFLTINQARLAFRLAAAQGRTVGYDRQCLPLSTIAASAFGWRTLARGAVSKLPGGLGVLPKSMVAFAGTYAVGKAMEHWFREGSRLERLAELRHYSDGLQQGRQTVERIVKNVLARSRTATGSA